MITKYIDFINEGKYYNNTLNPKLWDADNKLNQRIRGKLLTIANDFFNSLKLDTQIIDIQLTGSLANYNYTNYSDFDVHIIIDFKDVNNDVELVKSAVDNQRITWNIKHGITIKGYPIELYVQDVSEQHTASALFSLMNNEWVKEPKYNEPIINEEEVKTKTDNYTQIIDKLVELSNGDITLSELDEYYNYAKELKEKIHQGRKEGLQTKAGEFSVENLIFKELRNNGRFGQLIDIITKLYDRQYIQ